MPMERVRLYVVDAAQASDDATHAVWFRPGRKLVRDHEFPAPHDVRDANHPDHIDLHRIVVWRDASAPIVGALLRHELEHARQWDALGAGIFELYDLIKEGVLPYKAGALDGCAGVYINSMPAEQDANAAGAMYLSANHPDAASEIRKSDQRNLACSLSPPEAHSTLPARMVAYLALFPSACAAYAAAEDAPFAQVLESTYPGTGALWERIQQ
jgi:hypothetical protein